MAGQATSFWQNSLPAKLYKTWAMKIGRIHQLMTQPCEGNSLIAHIVAPFTEIPTALYGIAQHECKDAAWDGGRQAWLQIARRGGRVHGRGGTPVFKTQGIVRADRPAPKGFGMATIRFGDFLQHVGAAIVVVDTAINWDINWMSTALRWSGCPPIPPISGYGGVVGAPIGTGGRVLNMDAFSQGICQGVVFGIGGFATTEPASKLDVMYSVNYVPRGNAPFYPPASTRLEVKDAVTGGSYLGFGDSGSTPLEDDGGVQHWATQTFWASSLRKYTGKVVVTETTGPFEGAADIGSSTLYVTGDFQTSISSGFGQDPCKGSVLVQTPRIALR